MAKQITISFDDDMVTAIEALSSNPEGFVREVVEQEITRRTQWAALRDVAGLWRDREDIPDTPEAIVQFVRRMRADAERPQP